MRVIYIQPAVNHKPNVNNGFVLMDEDSNVVMLNASSYAKAFFVIGPKYLKK